MSDDRTEYILRIDVLTPESASLVRTAAYLDLLGKLLGQAEHVHPGSISAGSLKLHAWADQQAVPKIEERVANANDRAGDVYAIHQRLDKMLAADNAIGELYRKNPLGEPAKILEFPGRNRIKAREFKLKQQGTIEGFLIKLGGKDASIHAELDCGEGRYQKCQMKISVAKELAPYMFSQPVRLNGQGTWKRDEDGRWTIEDFEATSFDVLQDEDLPAALKNLREAPVDWGNPDDLTDELRKLRGDE